jgi:hypothetical protein
MLCSLRRSLPITMACIWAFATHVGATPANRAALERHFDGFLIKRLRNCTTCHLPSDVKDPQSLDDFPHNPFGHALAELGKQLKNQGKKRDIPTRIMLLASQDSDGDGVDNLTELLLGHNPGDAADVPTPAELREAQAKREEFAAFLKSYRWQPFEPATRPAVPTIAEGGRNPVDAFLAEQRGSRHLSPSPEAPKLVLLRRAYLDLIGLNPAPAEMAAFESDDSADAYEKVVDRLLADPRYGQRWARHWMDVWRYSDWAGYGPEVRDSQPFIWRWRDWIVESLNADNGYDRMLLEMLAADELCPNDDGALRATGFLVRNFKSLSREQWMEDTINHTTRGLLGLTMHCAKCHDHKFDPVTQEEYYRMRAIFEPHNVRTDFAPGSIDKKADGWVRAYDKDVAAQTLFYTRGDERTPDNARGPMTAGVPAALGGALHVQLIELPFRAAHPDRTMTVRRTLLAAANKTLQEARAKFTPMKDDAKLPQRQRSEAEANLSAAQARHDALAAVLGVEEIEDAGPKESASWKSAALATQSLQRRAAVAEASLALIAAQNVLEDARQRLDAANARAATQPAEHKAAIAKATADLAAAGPKIEPAQKALSAAVAALADPPTTAYKPRATDDYPDTSTGRRLAFARWLVDAKNPLTARVAVNHLWARHFGQGIVPTVDDFGRNGRAATHPALLDWLACELMRNGWHMKPLHRLIVTSAAYRQSSLTSESALAIDPDDVWLWRFPTRRMEAELVRDNVLYASGQLDCAMGGAEIDQTQAMVTHRRSLYLRVAAEKEAELLKTFDGPNPNECYLRRPSVMPQQALALSNSQLVIEQAQVLAKTLAEKHADGDDFIVEAFRHILARSPSDEERSACRAFLAEAKVPPDRAREDLLVVLFNHNDFVTIR